MSIEESITDKLKNAFTPVRLEVLNESHLHAGHAGSPGTGSSHFRVEIVSDLFSGKSRIERHRLVNDALAEELAGPIHALTIKAKDPSEAGTGDNPFITRR